MLSEIIAKMSPGSCNFGVVGGMAPNDIGPYVIHNGELRPPNSPIDYGKLYASENMLFA